MADVLAEGTFCLATSGIKQVTTRCTGIGPESTLVASMDMDLYKRAIKLYLDPQYKTGGCYALVHSTLCFAMLGQND
jgi:hypothetical protein